MHGRNCSGGAEMLGEGWCWITEEAACAGRTLVWALLGEVSQSWLGKFEGQGRRPHELPWGNRTPELQACLSELEKWLWDCRVSWRNSRCRHLGAPAPFSLGLLAGRSPGHSQATQATDLWLS